jgi:cobalt/nickel transport system permease protein
MLQIQENCMNHSEPSTTGTSIPEWMKHEENYTPARDDDGFITKSILAVMGILSRMRMSGRADRAKVSAPVKLFAVLYLILLISLSRNMFFSYLILAGLLIGFCLLPGRLLLRTLSGSLAAAGLSALLLLPSVFLGSPRTMLTVSCKVFLSVGMIGVLADTTPWNQITAGLAAFHVPDIFIFTFDLTLKYIVILGDTCVEMLQALRLRSVGRSRDKSRSFSGIFGVLYFKSRTMSEEMYQAMICRGYDGTYQKRKESGRKADPAAIVLLVLLTILFIRMERAIR